MTGNQFTSSERASLPAGWRWARLGDVCEINPSRSGKTGFSDDMLVTFAPMSSVDDESGTLANPIERKFGEVRKGYTQQVQNSHISQHYGRLPEIAISQRVSKSR